jgi:hypothetical protein
MMVLVKMGIGQCATPTPKAKGPRDSRRGWDQLNTHLEPAASSEQDNGRGIPCVTCKVYLIRAVRLWQSTVYTIYARWS